MPGALDGVRVLDFTEIIAGPMAAMLLSDMGADVLKIEPPWGDPWRQQSQYLPLEGRNFISLNRGKKSLPLDLTKPEAREIVYKLVPSTDVVIINYRPDVPYTLGIDYETLSAINPRLVYCENTAYGRQGPYGHKPGYDNIVQGLSGMMAGEGNPDVSGLPQPITVTAIADTATGLALAWGACAGLFARERTGKGQKIEATLLGTALALQTARFLQAERYDKGPREEFLEDVGVLRKEGRPYREINARYDAMQPRAPGNIYYRTFQTKDSILVIACLSDQLRKKMALILGLRDVRFEPGYDPASEGARAFGEELTRKAEAVFLTKTTQDWIQTLEREGIPCGPVLFSEELLDHEQVVANGLVVELEHRAVGPIKMVGPVLRMSETPLEARFPSPTLGQDTDEVLASLGYSRETIQRLRDAGVTR